MTESTRRAARQAGKKAVASEKSTVAAKGKAMAAKGKTMAETVVDAAETVHDAGEAAIRRVGRTARNAGKAGVEKAEEAHDALAGTGERLAERLRRSAARAQDIPGQISEGVTDMVERARGSAIGDIATDLRHMARRNPGVFMAGAAIAGFALARLLSQRPDRDD